jgi:signal transduction histidine kinase
MSIHSAALIENFPPDPDSGSVELELKKTRDELKIALRQLHATQQQLVQTERLRAMGALVNGMAHDFSNALAEILGNAELLQHKAGAKGADRSFGECAEKIALAALDAAEVVERLREFHRPPSTRDARISIPLDVLVQQAVDFTRPRWESERRASGMPVEVVTEFSSVAAISGNVGELRDMLTALLFNAMEAMPQGGRISIRTQLWGKRVELAIADSGAGMADEVRRRCFEPFFTTKGQRNAGLGLAMVYGVIERHSGTIEIESHRGRGTTVHLTFPIDATPAAASTVADLRPVKPLRILVVDDQPEQSELLAHLLGRDWHKVETAPHGHAAMKIFERTHFDLVITDKAMPDMNGDQLAVAVKGREPGTKVIMLTGFGPPEADSGEMSEFIDLVLAKPVNSAGLRTAIQQVMNGR